MFSNGLSKMGTLHTLVSSTASADDALSIISVASSFAGAVLDTIPEFEELGSISFCNTTRTDACFSGHFISEITVSRLINYSLG